MYFKKQTSSSVIQRSKATPKPAIYSFDSSQFALKYHVILLCSMFFNKVSSKVVINLPIKKNLFNMHYVKFIRSRYVKNYCYYMAEKNTINK